MKRKLGTIWQNTTFGYMENKITPTIGAVFITHHAKKLLPRSLPAFLNSPLKPRVLVVNSSSNDGTVETAEALGAETLVIPRKEFNHGSTREMARQHLKTDIIVMVTPDAFAKDNNVLEKLVSPLIEGKASASYARQIAHDGADFFESFPRVFNYPQKSHIRGIEDVETYGVYTFFCSNSCAAYNNKALDEIGGFIPVLLGEDTVAIAKLLKNGHKIAYVAEAIVQHSHRYTLLDEFKRNFDTGLARKEYRSLLELGGNDSKRGKEYVKEMTKHLSKEKPHLLPYACTQIMAKWLGYKIGSVSRNAPLWLKRKLTSQDFYWNSNAYIQVSSKVADLLDN